jgi:hypothetical protein
MERRWHLEAAFTRLCSVTALLCHHPPTGPREVARPDDRLRRMIQ